MSMDDINSVELVFDRDSPFVCMPDHIRCKADIPTRRQRVAYIGMHGSAAYLNLPDQPPEPAKRVRDDGPVLARSDLKTTLEKAKWIGANGEDAWLNLPAERAEAE